METAKQHKHIFFILDLKYDINAMFILVTYFSWKIIVYIYRVECNVLTYLYVVWRFTHDYCLTYLSSTDFLCSKDVKTIC